MFERVIKLCETFAKYNVEYLFVGKYGAILYGYPGTTQDIDIFPKKSKINCKNIVKALSELGFYMDEVLEKEIIAGKDFIQMRGGPFPLDLVFAPDGIESFEDAKKRSKVVDNRFPCASIEDIIASKRAAKRQMDNEELPRLESFKAELQRNQ